MMYDNIIIYYIFMWRKKNESAFSYIWTEFVHFKNRTQNLKL